MKAPNNVLAKITSSVSVIIIALLLIYSFTFKSEQAYTPATLSFTLTTQNNGGTYAPSNILAVWITKQNGDFVKTLFVKAGIRKSKLYTWISQSSGNTVDAVTGPTLSSFGTYTITWNGTNSAKNIVADGTYKLHIENASTNQQGPYTSFEFTKGESQYTVELDDKTYFKNMSISYTPTQVSIEHISYNKPQLTISPSRGKVFFNFTGNEFDDVSLSIFAINGTIVYSTYNPYYINSINTIEWNGIDLNGNKVPTGTYICKHTIHNTVLTQKFFFTKL